MSGRCVACKRRPAQCAQGWCGRCAVAHALANHPTEYVIEQVAPAVGLTEADVRRSRWADLTHTLAVST